MPRLYKAKKESILQELHSCRAFGFTTDMWTSRSTHSYVSFTVHFITDEYHLKHYLLETKEFTQSHTAQNIAEEMTSIINEWGLESADLIAATTDNASNIRAALHILQCLHMPCFSHVQFQVFLELLLAVVNLQVIFIVQPMLPMYSKESKQTCIVYSITYYMM